MAKYVNQDIYDGSIALLALAKLVSDSEYQRVLNTLRIYYKDDYSGDYQFSEDLELGTKRLLEKYNKIEHEKFKYALDMASKMRPYYDDNMQKKSALKKIFGGTKFTSGHPNPSVRVEVGLLNMSSLIDTVIHNS